METPRFITEEIIISLIVKKTFFNTGKTTVCVLELNNSFEVVGTSAVVDKALFNEELGKQYALEGAINKIWELEGYRLQCERARYPKEPFSYVPNLGDFEQSNK
jgi:hypothetical protein